MNEFAITAIGHDRPGIVGGFTKVLLDLGCNLADCSMSMLRDQFAMILLVEAPDSVAIEQLNTALRQAAAAFGLLVETRPVIEEPVQGGAAAYVLSVYGQDRPGIVHAVARTLGDSGVNITDLRSHLAGLDLYAMILDIAVPPSVDLETLVRQLQYTTRDLGVSLTVRSAEAAEL
ncbi:MAG TPA: ACT domain-containing protein [Actinomycetota bacterium]|nr:ACT domain-containing protein [Actinomycetota bacterium]